MANICFDTVIFYLRGEADNSALCKLSNDLKTCYPSLAPAWDHWIGILFDYLQIPISGYYLRGNIGSIELHERWIRLDLDTAWKPLFEAYKALAKYYGLFFVLKAEEPGDQIFINTDVAGQFLDTRCHILLNLEKNPVNTPYEMPGTGGQVLRLSCIGRI